MNKDCLYVSKTGVCELAPQTEDGMNFTLIQCEENENCPFKKFKNGLITEKQFSRLLENLNFLFCKRQKKHYNENKSE
jgi:hypothetical protein